MTTYNTGNPIGSTAVKDLYDNAENLDTAVNDTNRDTWSDRLGQQRKTWHGMENSFDSFMGSSNASFQQFLISSGYQDLGDYKVGLEITARNQIFRKDGELYRASAGLELPYTTSGDWPTEGDSFVSVGDAALRQELADPDMGAAMVSRGVVAVDSIADLLALPQEQRRPDLRYLVKGYHTNSDVGGGEFYWDSTRQSENDGGVVLNGFVRVFDGTSYNIDWFGAIPGAVMGSTDQIKACWDAAKEGGTIVIPNADYRIDKTLDLKFKHLNIKSSGRLLVDDGDWVGVDIHNSDDFITIPGTNAGPIEAYSREISIPSLPDIDPSKYYTLLLSTETLITRVGDTDTTPYQKLECHDITGPGFVLGDPILYTYSFPELLDIVLVPKRDWVSYSGLSIVCEETESPTRRTLFRLYRVSKIEFFNLSISHEGNQWGNGLNIDQCCHLKFDSPEVNGYTKDGGDSYKIINGISSNITFTNLVSKSPRNGTGTTRDYSARHGNLVSFINCNLSGVDDHFGSNYSFDGCTFTSIISFSGRNLSVTNSESYSSDYLVQIRGDTPYCDGSLIMDNIRLYGGGLLYSASNIAEDPLGRTTDLKTFDNISISNIFPYGTQKTSSLIHLLGPRNPLFNFIGSDSLVIKNARAYPFVEGLGYSFMTYMHVSFNTVVFDNVDFTHKQSLDGSGSEVTGLKSSVPGINSRINTLSMLDCTEISTGDIYGVVNFTIRGGTLNGRSGLQVNNGSNDTMLILDGVEIGPTGQFFMIGTANGQYRVNLVIRDCTIRTAAGERSLSTDFMTLAHSSGNVCSLNAVLPSILPKGLLRHYVHPSIYEDE